MGDLIVCDFSIEKDLVYAKMNLNQGQLVIFEQIYNHIINEVGIPNTTIYVDLSLKILKRRIFQRGRSYEINAEHDYFIKYNDRAKDYFRNYANSKMHFLNVDDLVLDPDNPKLCMIRELIHGVQNNG